MTPPTALTTLDSDLQLRLLMRREPWTPIDSRRSCDHSRLLPRGAPRAASCPARRLPVSSVSAPGQQRRAGGTIPVGVRTARRPVASAGAAATAPASMSYARRGTAAPAPPPAPTARNAPEEVAVSRRRPTLVVPVPPRAAPAVHRRPTGRREPPHPAAEISRHARVDSAPAPDTARSLPEVWLSCLPARCLAARDTWRGGDHERWPVFVRPSSIPARSSPESRRRRLRHGSAPSATWLPPRTRSTIPPAAAPRCDREVPAPGRYSIDGPAFDRLTAGLGSDETRRRVLSGLGLAISAIFVGRSIIGRITAGTGPPGPSTTGRCTRQCNVDAKAARAACGAKVKTSNARVGCRSDARTTRAACRAGCPPKEEAPVAIPPNQSGT